MIPICVIAEKLPRDLEEKVKGKSLHHVRSAVDALAYFQENPDTIFLVLMKEEQRTLEILKTLSKTVPPPKIAVLSDSVSAEFEMRAMEAGAMDILSRKLSFSDLCRRMGKIRDYVKPPSSKASAGSILIVDDDSGVRNFLSRVFIKKGYETLLADSGEKALEILGTSAPSVVLLDMMMPGMGGMETLQRLLEKKPDLGVVMATGLCDEELAQKAMESGAYAYVMKPFDLPYLEMVVLTRLCLAS